MIYRGKSLREAGHVRFYRFQTSATIIVMDVIERHLSAFITSGAVDWKTYVQGFTWAVTLFESYLL